MLERIGPQKKGFDMKQHVFYTMFRYEELEAKEEEGMLDNKWTREGNGGKKIGRRSFSHFTQNKSLQYWKDVK